MLQDGMDVNPKDLNTNGIIRPGFRAEEITNKIMKNGITWITRGGIPEWNFFLFSIYVIYNTQYVYVTYVLICLKSMEFVLIFDLCKWSKGNLWRYEGIRRENFLMGKNKFECLEAHL